MHVLYWEMPLSLFIYARLHVRTLQCFTIVFAAGSDPDYFANLTEVEKSLVAVVVGNTYISEEIEIKVRRCPDGFHYYLKPPKTRPAVYCFGELFSSCK